VPGVQEKMCVLGGGRRKCVNGDTELMLKVEDVEASHTPRLSSGTSGEGSGEEARGL